jgi:hypothetical protein
MISFRLTAEEYEKFRELCFTQGIGSISEMARAAINMLLQQPARAPQEALESRVAELEGRLHMLALELKKLNQDGQAVSHHSPRLAACAITAR